MANENDNDKDLDEQSKEKATVDNDQGGTQDNPFPNHPTPNELSNGDSNEEGDNEEDSGDDNQEANEAERASQNPDSRVVDPETGEPEEPDDDAINAEGGIDQGDVDNPSPSSQGQFDNDTAQMTKANSDQQQQRKAAMDSLLDPVDSDLKRIRSGLDQTQENLKDWDPDSPRALNDMKDILIKNNDTEQKLYKLVNQLEYNSADYAAIKDKLVNEGEKKDISKLLDKLRPLFSVTSDEQMHTFMRAFDRISSIEKNGSLTNLIELAQYYQSFQKKQKTGGSDQDEDDNPESNDTTDAHNDDSSSDDGNNGKDDQ